MGNHARPETDELNHVSERGVTVQGTLMTFEQLEAVFHLLTAATDGHGKINGNNFLFSPYTREHFTTTRTMMMVMSEHAPK
jgi:hypothetical protein